MKYERIPENVLSHYSAGVGMNIIKKQNNPEFKEEFIPLLPLGMSDFGWDRIPRNLHSELSEEHSNWQE